MLLRTPRHGQEVRVHFRAKDPWSVRRNGATGVVVGWDGWIDAPMHLLVRTPEFGDLWVETRLCHELTGSD